MKVLVTGGLGNIGSAVVHTLLDDGVEVRVFEQKTKINLRKATDAAMRVARAAVKAIGLGKRQVPGAEIAWGDLADGSGLAEAVAGCDGVVHMAYIIPPTSERRTSWARNINVEGTRRLLEACRRNGRNPRVVFASSISVYGNSQGKQPPRRVGDELLPIDAYGKMKVECENMLMASGLPWTILRVAAAPTIDWKRIDPIMFDIPMTDRIEFVHPEDAGFAFAKAVQSPEAAGRILQIGGGARCQMTQYEFMRKSLVMLGVGMLPQEAFGRTNYHTDWMDTEEGQDLFHYQRKDFDTFLREQRRRYGMRKVLVVLGRPIARLLLVMNSPYYREYVRRHRNRRPRTTML
jgi:UDP-glucose 4-epimerase